MGDNLLSRQNLLRSFMIVQALVPFWFLLKPTNDGPQRFAWQMFSRPLPFNSYHLILADGHFIEVTRLATLHPPLRADIMLTPELLAYACAEQPEAQRLEIKYRNNKTEQLDCPQTRRHE